MPTAASISEPGYTDIDSTELVRSCVKRAAHWRVPPNWTLNEWTRELSAHAAAAAHEARCEYDSARGLDSAAFVVSRVMAGLLTRYRQEWRFALRSVDLSLASSTASANGNRLLAAGLKAAVARLPGWDRWLLGQVFWKDRRQSELASELGVSQPAISKKYRRIIDDLRCHLSQ